MKEVELVAACLNVFTENHEILGHSCCLPVFESVDSFGISILFELIVCPSTSQITNQLAHLFLFFRSPNVFGTENVLNFKFFPFFSHHDGSHLIQSDGEKIRTLQMLTE